jgi:hypothetical protein
MPMISSTGPISRAIYLDVVILPFLPKRPAK